MLMKYKIIIKKGNGKLFTYLTDAYSFEKDFFIKFKDDRGITRSFPKSDIDEVNDLE